LLYIIQYRLSEKSRFPFLLTDIIKGKDLHALLGNHRPKITEIVAVCHMLN